jgi:hypothetical protein
MEISFHDYAVGDYWRLVRCSFCFSLVADEDALDHAKYHEAMEKDRQSTNILSIF